ncbi:hypothetical protein Ndes2526B_g08757 [Nannochloris sp. 'desiccata']
MSAVSAITAHIGVSNLVAISSSRRGNAPRMICSAHFMNMPRPQFSSNSFKSNITKNGGTKGFFNSSSKSRASFTPCAALVNVEFLVPELPLEFGQSLKIVGGAPSLGNWEASTGAVLEWQEGNNWKGAAEVEVGSEVEFKLVKVAGEDWSSWEDGENKVFAIPATATGVEVICLWEGDISIEVSEATAVVEEKPKKSSSSSSSKAKAPKKAKKEEKADEPIAAAAAAAAPAAAAPAAAAPAAAAPAAVVVAEKEENAAPQEPAAVAAPAAVVVAEKEERPSHQEKEKDAPAESAPTHSNGAAAAAAPSTGVDISSEMSSLANAVSVGSDGSLMIEFNSNADGVTAASLAAKLK